MSADRAPGTAQQNGPAPEASVAGQWSAVTRNLSGVLSGVLDIPVAANVPSLDELLAEPPAGDQEDDDDADDD